MMNPSPNAVALPVVSTERLELERLRQEKAILQRELADERIRNRMILRELRDLATTAYAVLDVACLTLDVRLGLERAADRARLSFVGRDL